MFDKNPQFSFNNPQELYIMGLYEIIGTKEDNKGGFFHEHDFDHLSRHCFPYRHLHVRVQRQTRRKEITIPNIHKDRPLMGLSFRLPMDRGNIPVR